MRLLLTLPLALVACAEEPTETADQGSAADDWTGAGSGEGGGDGADQSGADDIEVPETGDPVDPPEAGTAWRLWIAELEVSDPPGGAALLDALLEEDSLIFYVDWTAASSFGMLVAMGIDGVQDVCEVPQELPAADFADNPLFLIESADIEIDPSGAAMTARDTTLMGMLEGDGWSWGALRASLDTRDFEDELAEAGLDACELLEDLGSACVPCDDGEELCMELAVDDLVAEPYPETFDPDAGDAC